MQFDIRSAEFWDEAAMHQEMVRVFDVCHSCRVCYTLCPSFVKFFEVTDDIAGIFGNVEELDTEQIHLVTDLCNQCKICDPICPYTPPHALDLDFPRTLVRYNFLRKKREGVSLRDRMFGHVDLVGTMSSWFAPLVNWANNHPLIREQMQEYLGIHKDRHLPKFHFKTFWDWAKCHAKRQGTGKDKVLLYYTCTVNYNEPDIAKAAVAVLEKNGVECWIPKQQCCGLPFVDSGMPDHFMKQVKANVELLVGAVRQGYKIVVPSASCSYMLKHDYPDYWPGEEAKLIAQNTYDLSEYLVMLHEQGKLNTEFSQSAGKIRYHQPCHLMAQEHGMKPKDLLQLIPGTEVNPLQCCSGHDGAWSVKTEYFEESMKMGAPLFKFMAADESACCASDCPLSALQIEQATGRKVIHPIEIMANAYGMEYKK